MRTVTLIVAVLINSTLAYAKSGEEKPSREEPNVAQDREPSSLGGVSPIDVEDWFTKIRLPEIQGIPSFVVVTFAVSKDGRAFNCRVLEPNTPTRFAREEVCGAIEQRAKFEPARHGNGKPRTTHARMAIRFEV